MKNKINSLTILAVIALPICAHSQNLLGAKEVTKRINEGEISTGKPKLPTAFEFAANLAKLPPKQAGEAWARACIHKPEFAAVKAPGIEFDEDEFSALPPPESWVYADAYFTKSKAQMPFRMLGSYLVGDRIRLRKFILQAGNESKNSVAIWSTMLSFGLAWHDKELASVAIHQMVANQNIVLANKDPRKKLGKLDGLKRLLRIPDLGRLALAPRTKLIHYALKNAKCMVLFPSKGDLQIAVSLCRKEGLSYPIPRYELIQFTSSADLYPQLAKWFPKVESEAKLRANAFYTQCKLLEGRSAINWDDLKLIAKSKYENQGYNPVVQVEDDFNSCLKVPIVASRTVGLFEKQLRVKPTYELLENYHTIVDTLGSPKRMIPVLEHIISFGPKGKYEIVRREAADLMVQVLADVRTNQQIADMMLEHLKQGCGNTRMAMTAGQFLGRTDLVEAALTEQKAGDQDDYLESLMELKRYAALESDALRRPFGGAEWLLKGYIELGRYQDVVDMVDKYPNWYQTDVSGLSFGYRSDPETNGCFGVAKALLKVGRRNAGLRVLRRSFWSEGPVGPAYSLLVETLGDTAALRELNQMIADDQFTSGPLVWKAKILAKQGKLAEAEVSVRQELEAEPISVRRYEKRDHMARTILADILISQGRATEAKKQTLLVDATLKVDEATEYIHAGFVGDGIKRLQSAVSACPESCYAQGVLAMALLDAGRGDEAKAHFRMAFQLLPDNVSRTGERPTDFWDLFDEPLAQSIAESVFKEKLTKEPNNPHLYYLLARLRDTQHRYVESGRYVWRTIELDPGYLGAYALTNELHRSLEPAQAEQIGIANIRLDPRRRYGYMSRDDLLMLNLKEYYRAFQYANQFHFENEAVYPLAAAIQARNKNGYGYSTGYSSPADTLPGKGCFETKLMKSLHRLIVESRGEGYFSPSED